MRKIPFYSELLQFFPLHSTLNILNAIAKLYSLLDTKKLKHTKKWQNLSEGGKKVEKNNFLNTITKLYLKQK